MGTKQDLPEGQLDIFEAMERAAQAVEQMEQGEQISAKKNAKIIRGKEMHSCMQKTFLNPVNDDFAMAAYIDYHMVYVKDWNEPASLKEFDSSKDAVEYYIEKIKQIEQTDGIRMCEQNEPFSDVAYAGDHVYMEV